MFQEAGESETMYVGVIYSYFVLTSKIIAQRYICYKSGSVLNHKQLSWGVYGVYS